MRANTLTEMKVDDQALVERLAGRYACAACGGHEFKRRADDNPETRALPPRNLPPPTAPLLPYDRAKGVLHRVDSMAAIAQVAAAIDSALAR